MWGFTLSEVSLEIDVDMKLEGRRSSDEGLDGSNDYVMRTLPLDTNRQEYQNPL